MGLRILGTGAALYQCVCGGEGVFDAKGSLLRLLVSSRKPLPPPIASCLDNTEITA